MSSIPKVSLEDTYSLVQLLRETALARGKTDQADQLSPVMNGMRDLVKTNRSASATSSAATTPATPTGLMAQSDFQKLLEISQDKNSLSTMSDPSATINERNRLVTAMSAANMNDLDIAKQLGMTREEVNLVLDTSQQSSSIGGASQ